MNRLSVSIAGTVIAAIFGLCSLNTEARGRGAHLAKGAALTEREHSMSSDTGSGLEGSRLSTDVGLAARGVNGTGPTLSRDQLRDCVTQQNQLEADAKSLSTLDTELQSKLALIQNLEANIAQSKPQVDQYSQESIDSYNALARQYKMLVSTYNGSLPDHKSWIKEFKIAQQRFNSKCVGQTYSESDMKAVLAGN